MIQINLIPDIKKEYLRARRMRDLTISVSILVGLAAGGLVVAMVLFLGTQALRESLADNAIKDEYAKLEQIEGLSEMVTIQNQLSLISSQHESSTRDSRLFSVLQTINPPRPNDVRFSSVQLIPETDTLELQGTAAAGYPAVEELVKTISSVNIRYDDEGAENGRGETPLAQEVIIGDTSYGVDGENERILRFSVKVVYAPDLFKNTIKDVEIDGPRGRINVTDSRVRVPDSLFTAPARDLEEEE